MGSTSKNGEKQGGETKEPMRKKCLLAQNITVLQSFGKQPPFSIFSHRADATSTKSTETSNCIPRSIGDPISVGTTALSPYPPQPG